MRDLLLVAAGGAIGATLRFGVGAWMPKANFPWPTLLVNLAGCLLLGAIMPGLGDSRARLFLAVGVLGAFTTLSTFGVETVDLLRQAKHGLAALNIASNGLGGPIVAWFGWRLADALGWGR